MTIQKNSFKVFLVTLVLMLLTSCVTTRRTNYLQNPDLLIPAYSSVDSVGDYRLLIGDELNITIFSLEEEANTVFNQGRTQNITSSNSKEKNIYTYTVYADGCINYPVVGSLYVEGRTLREISVLLKEKLKDQFIVNDFSVIINLVNNSFSIISEKGSGKYLITSSNMTIFQAIASSMDLPEYADRAHVKIIRQTTKGTVVKVFDIRSTDILNSEFYYVKPNDVIYVQSYDGQFFRLSNFGTVLSVIMTTITLGLFVWTLTGL